MARQKILMSPKEFADKILERERIFRGITLTDSGLDQYVPQLNKFLQKNEPLDLRDSHLTGINAPGLYLPHVQLQGAYLEGANLEGANLEGAYLWRACLERACLLGANLGGANLTGVQGIDTIYGLGRAHFLETRVTAADKRIIEAAIEQEGRRFIVA